MSWLCPETYMLWGLVASQVGDYGDQTLITASGASTTPREYIKQQYGCVPYPTQPGFPLGAQPGQPQGLGLPSTAAAAQCLTQPCGAAGGACKSRHHTHHGILLAASSRLLLPGSTEARMSAPK